MEMGAICQDRTTRFDGERGRPTAHDPAPLTASFKEPDAMPVPKAAHEAAHKASQKAALWEGIQ
jgi:hypothetical protein